VTRLWMAILQASFPYGEGFHFSFEVNRSAGRADLILNRTSDKGVQVEVLVMECKSPKHDQNSEWESAREQTLAYLADSPNSNPTIYGAVAIGKKVQFFRATQIGSNDRPSYRIFDVPCPSRKVGPLHSWDDKDDLRKIFHDIRVQAQEYGWGTLPAE